MKGRRKELTRAELHEFLRKKLGLVTIHSEYGMTELLSQDILLVMEFFVRPHGCELAFVKKMIRLPSVGLRN
jgi:hypothetical protein